MPSVLITSTMKSDPGVPLPRAGSRGVPVSASAAFPEGGSAEGALGVLGACATRSADRAGALIADAAVAAPAATTPVRNLRRSAFGPGSLRDMVSSSSSASPGGDSNPVRIGTPTPAKSAASFLRVENPRPTPRGCSPEPVNISTGRAFIGRPLMKPESIPAEHIDERILFVRAHKVMLDADLAALYGVPTKVLVQAVRRNIERFPQDFMVQ